MCGIAGWWKKPGAGLEEKPSVWAEKMAAALRHRGPDSQGVWEDVSSGFGLGHRRLAIVDLSEAGHQPMISRDGRWVLVYNGEIYNHQEIRRELEAVLGSAWSWRGTSDTETLLEACAQWGLPEALKRAVGMFALAMWDRSTQTLHLARDRAGEKPLFIYQRNGLLAFASELKAILTLPMVERRLDHEALEYYLAYGYVPAPRCLLQGMQKVPPAEIWSLHQPTGKWARQRYWALPVPATEICPWEEAQGEVERLLDRSVRGQLEADVPVGVLLSGGIDSGLVAALAARRSGRKVRTFTISFPGHRDHDEGPLAREVARHLGTEHHELAAQPGSVDLLPTLARIYDEPIADTSMVPTYLVNQMLRQEVTVALAGDGGDELFAGYPHHRAVPRLARLRRWLPYPVRWAVESMVTQLPVGVRGRGWLLGMSGARMGPLAGVNLYFDRVLRQRLLQHPYAGSGLTPENYRDQLTTERDGSWLERAMRADFLSTLPNGFLVKTDRASMAHSVELRCPFLDHRLIEFAFGRLGDAARLRGELLKPLTRALAAKLLPPAIALGPKRGFVAPLQEWSGGTWGKYLTSILENLERAPLRQEFIQQLLRAQAAGRANMNRIFQLVMLELWMREYKIEPGTAAEVRA